MRNKTHARVEYPNHSWGTALIAGNGLTCVGCGAIIHPTSLYTKHYNHRTARGNQPFCVRCFPFWLDGTTAEEKREVVETWESPELFASVDE